MAAAAPASHAHAPVSETPAAVQALGWACVVLAAGLAVLFGSYLPAIAEGQTFRYAVPWVPGLGIGAGVELSVLIDGLSLLFALLITGIGAFVFLYSGSYLAGHPQLGRYYVILLLFMLAMLGIVLADDLITLYVAWELTTITSFLLIGFDHDDAKARRSALQGLLVTATGGLAMLAGFILIGLAAGTFRISEITAGGDVLRDHALYLPILILVLAGAFTKSAQFPFHFWLPNAMAAPTPISAYLHSATMVKGGVYLLARLQTALDATDVWTLAVTAAGAVTAVLGAVLALRQTDLKLMLAYTTVMALGTCILFLGIDSPIAQTAAITFILVHALYKAALFLVVGAIDHETGTRDVTRLGGLRHAMPATAAAALVAGLSMAGLPPLIGFIGKELTYKGALASPLAPDLFALVMVVANAAMVSVAAILVIKAFFGEARPTPRAPHEAPVRMWAGPAVLAVLSLLAGIFPWLIDRGLIAPGVMALGEPDSYALALWHGINLALLLSGVTIAIGVALFLARARVRAGLDAIGRAVPWSGDRAYDGVMAGLVRVARVQTDWLQGGVMRRYLLIVFATMALAVGGTLVLRGGLAWTPAWPDLLIRDWMLIGLIAAGALLAVAAESRLAAICGLGTVGVGVALVFLMYGAPDLALTQLLVETLVVVIVGVVMLRLPDFRGAAHPGRFGRVRDGVVALACGGVVTALILAVLEAPLDRRLTDYYEITAVPGGEGRNIVNVILVDFRALDTLGEIAVVGIAGLTAYALIKLRAGPAGTRQRSRR